MASFILLRESKFFFSQTRNFRDALKDRKRKRLVHSSLGRGIIFFRKNLGNSPPFSLRLWDLKIFSSQYCSNKLSASPDCRARSTWLRCVEDFIVGEFSKRDSSGNFPRKVRQKQRVSHLETIEVFHLYREYFSSI